MDVARVYPASLIIDYPDRPLNRLTTLLRVFTAIPLIIIFTLLISPGSFGQGGNIATTYAAAGFVFLPTLLMIVFRQKYPRWWYDWNFALLGYSYRFFSYLLLMTDEFPSTDEDQSVHVTLSYPDARTELNRWLPLVKWLLAIPHIIVLIVLFIAAYVTSIIAWFAILFTGRYPRSLFDFVLNVMRYDLRVTCYALILVTDQYPPFSLSA